MTSFRNIALIGPYSSGKTTLLEGLLYVSDTITRRGSVRAKNTVGDASTEARARQMSTEVTAATFKYGSLLFTFLDCPGSVELYQETLNAIVGVDIAVVVCEPDPVKLLTLAPLFQVLDDWQIPHLVFLNKMDRAAAPFQSVLAALKQVSSRPLVLQQYPIGSGDTLKGFIDLITEQAFQYHPDAPADPIALPEALRAEEQTARAEMLETLAEYDDHLLEELLEDIDPPQAEVLQDLQNELKDDLIVPVLFGIADQAFGIRPLLEVLVKESPDALKTAELRGLEPALESEKEESPIAQVLKTYISAQGGKLSLVRVWQGTLTDGMSLNKVRVGGIYRLLGQQQSSVSQASAGEIVALGRMEGIQTGDTLQGNSGNSNGDRPEMRRARRLEPVFAQAVRPQNRKDEVKLTTALNKLHEEDPSLIWEHRENTHEIVIWGQGDIHLLIGKDRLDHKYRLPIDMQMPQVPYCETIRKASSSHGRYKHQTGGHGQFGDVYLDIKPQPRGQGFEFNETVVGGVVPKQYIPGVEMGVREFLVSGFYGFPIVDVAVTLTHGSYHTVDSSEQAFKQAARLAMQSGVERCEPVLLEPIKQVFISTPAEFTSSILKLVRNRRGQVLGYEAKAGWSGWDEVSAYLPMAEMRDLIIELRSLTQGAGFFDWRDDHLEEVPEKIAEGVLSAAQSKV
jgi:elongation factor G